MLRFLMLLLSSATLLQPVRSQTDTTVVDSMYKRIFLVGDAGELVNDRNMVIDWLTEHVDWNDETNMVLFLGDNIYEVGLPDRGTLYYEEAVDVLEYQINLVRDKKAMAYFIPGNHDWKNGKIGGLEQVKNQVNYINRLQLPNVQAFPTEGCPGPIEIDLGEKIVIVLLDSQWWLHTHEKPGPDSYCDYKNQDAVITALSEIAALHPGELMVVAMHHPMFSYGVHGGNYTWRHHIFPLTELADWLYLPMPIVGSIYPVARGIFGNIQDVRHPLYRTMISSIENVLRSHPNAVHVSGHDHSMQLLVKDSVPYIVSGSGAKVTRVRSSEFTEYAAAALGFATLEVRNSGAVETKFYTMASADLDDPVFTKKLDTIRPLEPVTLIDSLRTLEDSVVVTANSELAAGGFKRFMFGDNYREEWTTPVKVRVLDILNDKGGLKPTERGGGKQTKSLRVEDSTGKEYQLRTIEKFPEAALPADLQKTIAKDIVEDGISASYPYGALSYGTLAQAAGIPYLRRELVYIPDDPLLGRFRKDFANTMVIMEEREPSWTDDTDNSNDLVLKLLEDHDDHVDQKRVLKARLLDNYVMDFDRHEDQWRWSTYDTGKGKMYFPIPRDHDQVFFINEGVIPKFLRKPWFIPQIQGFEAEAENIKTFNFAARNFDRAFLNELSEDDWSSQIDTFLSDLTDEVFREALNQQPEEIRQFSYNEILNKLQERRKYFKNEMMDYYRFISKTVNVVGSNQDELFRIDRNTDGSVLVQVWTVKKEGPESLIYQRLFDPEVTKEIRIYGMGDKDSFHLRGTDNRKIKLRIIGGSGDDVFVNNADGKAGRTIVYDVSYEDNVFEGNPLRTSITGDATNNRYNRLYYNYDLLHPDLGLGFNVDDGLYVGGRIRYTKYGFRKEPHAQHHDFRLTRAFATGAYNIRYTGELISAVGRADVLMKADVKAPRNTTNFFGLGNETEFDKSKPGGVRYYRSRFNIADISTQLRYRLQSWMDVLAGPSYQYYSLHRDDNLGRVLDKPSETNLDSNRIYRKKSFLGAQAGVIIDTRNNNVLPTRGLHLRANARGLKGITGGARTLLSVDYDMAIFISFIQETKFVFATRFGVGHNFGNFEFFQAQYLSGLENLRGFRKDRFAGRTKIYFNNEVRYKIADFTTYLLPGSLGLHAFFDVGRVWMDNDPSRVWHTGWGGGVWVSPLRRIVLTGSVGVSKEEVLPYFTLGFQF